MLNRWIEFKIISQVCSLCDPQPKLLKPFRSVKKYGQRSLKKKKTLGFLGDPLTKLLKPFRSDEQHGRQGYK